MTATDENLTIYFADIGGSTALYEALGNEQASVLIIQALEDMSASVRRNDGRVLRTVGDEVLATFPSPDQAVKCARETQNHFDAMHRLGVRVGFHHGEAIAEGGDVYGAAVNLAARLSSLANIGEVLTSDTTALLLADDLDDDTFYIEKWISLDLKGINDQVSIRRVRWRKADTGADPGTQIISTQRYMETPLSIVSVLKLRYGDQEFDHREGKITLGRSLSCDMQINADMASRSHGTIEYKNGKYYFSDESSNGTYLRKNGDEVIRYFRESFVLSGAGDLGLGKAPGPRGQDSVSYEVTEELVQRSLNLSTDDAEFARSG